MDKIYIFLYLAMFISAGIGALIGAVKYFKPRQPLYASMIVLGVVCITMGRAYSFLRLVTGLEIEGIFQVGMLGTLGAFAFFFSANFGQIDSLVDDGGKLFSKYRLISALGILVVPAMYAFIFFGDAPNAEKAIDAVVFVAIAAACYFHIKHIIIPDVDYGVVKSLRLYNTFALLYGLLCMFEITAAANGLTAVRIVVCILECIDSLILVPVMDRGVQKWKK